jgi:spore germination protein (amino acid permease)
MMGRRSLSGAQFTLLLLVSYLTVGMFTFPKEVVEAAGPAGIYSVLATTALALGSAVAVAWIGSHFPGRSAVQWGDDLLTRPVARSLMTVGILIHAALPAVILRTFAEMLKVTFFPVTPVWVLVTSAVVVAFVGAELGVEAVGRATVVALPLMLAIMGTAYLLATPLLDAYRLRAAWEAPGPFLHGCLHAGLLYEGAGSLLLLQSKLEVPRRALRYVAWCFAISSAFLLLVYVATVAAFGRSTLDFLTWPAPQLLLTVRLSGWFVERLGLFVEVVWAGLVVLHTAVHLWVTALGTVQLLGLRERQAYGWAVAAMALLSGVAATLLPDVETVHAAFRVLPWAGIYLNLLLPLLWFAGGWLGGVFRRT